MRFFSGRQVVAIVVALCATIVLVPTTVWAAGSSLVKLTDGTGRVAQIDGKGRLFVTDGKGPMTVDGTVRVAPGRKAIPVKGSVNVRPSAGSTPWDTVNGVNLSSGNYTDVLYQGTVGHNLNLSSFVASADAASSGSVRVYLQVYVNSAAGGSCNPLTGNFGAAERFVIMVPVGQTVVLTYPTPLVYTQYGTKGHLYCVNVQSSGGPAGYEVHIGANGYIS
jgi:hypothetical protein